MNKTTKLFAWCIAALLSSGQAVAAVCTSVSAGRWDQVARWDCGHIPLSTDTVVIANNSVQMRGNYTVAGLSVNTGAVLDGNNRNLTVNGAVTISGTFDFNGGNAAINGNVVINGTLASGGDAIQMTGANTTLSGTGNVVDTTIEIDATGVSVPVGANLKFDANSEIDVAANVSLASLTVNGTLDGTAQATGDRIISVSSGGSLTVGSTGFINAPNSELNVLDGATATNNGTITIRDIISRNRTPTPVFTQGANSTLNVSGTVCATACTFNASAAGNTVNYSGNGQTVMLPSGAAYSNLTLNGSITMPPAAMTISGNLNLTAVGAASLILMQGNVTVYGTTTGAVNLVSTCPVDYKLTLVSSGVVMHSCGPGTQQFDAVEVGAAIGTPIRTKIAGQVFNLDVLAVKNGAIDTGYKRIVTVDLIAGTAACAATIPALAGVTVVPVPYTYIPATDNGRHTFSFTSSDAYPDVQVRVQDNNGKIGCSFDNFAIRPASFTVSVTDSDWQTAGTTRPLTNTGASGGNVHKAGRPFTVQATAVNAAGVTTANYAGTPAALLTQCAGTACTAIFGTFPVSTAAVAGVINSNTATYSEAGSFALQLQDQTFANVDAVDSTAAQRYISSTAINVGRFVPDHFVLSAASIANRSDIPCPTCTFTYMGEQMNALFTLTAQAAGGSTTQNYAGVLARLDPTAAGNPLVFGAVDSTATPTYLTARLDTSLTATGGFVAGVANVTAPLAITHPTTGCPTAPNCPDGPYALLDIGIAPQDGDGVIMAAYDLDTDAIVGNDHTKVGRTEVRYGRIKISNAYGSELLPLPMTATVQFYNTAGGWVTSNTDNMTTISNSDFALAFPVAAANKLAACETALSIAGNSPNFRINLSMPGTGNNGWTDLTLNLGAIATGNRCTAVGGAGAASTTSNQPWLQHPAGSNPTARATFGVYKGRNDFIYQRESY